MRKIVVNKCYGGFGLSHEGILEYAKRKGIKIYLEKKDSTLIPWEYWTVSENERIKEVTNEQWVSMSIEERHAYNKTHKGQTLYHRDIPRDDPALVGTVEALGKLANGSYAELSVVEIPDDVEWQIEEYDGREWIAEKHRTW